MIRVIGLGSPFCDDQAGWWVVKQLSGRVPSHVDLVVLDRPGAALINWMTGVDHLHLVDAVLDDSLAPGQVLTLDAAQLDREQRRLTSHQLDLTETLRLAEALHCRPARVDIHGIAIHERSAPGGRVRAAANQLALTLADRIHRELHAETVAG